MSKETGLGWTTLSIEESDGTTARNIRNDLQSVTLSTPMAVLDVTGLDSYAMERLLGLADGSATFNGTFNDAAGLSHDVFKTVCSTRVARDVVFTVSGMSLPMNMLLTDYPLSRATDGSLTYAVPASLANGTAPTWTTA
jgi:hypothetical protein